MIDDKSTAREQQWLQGLVKGALPGWLFQWMGTSSGERSGSSSSWSEYYEQFNWRRVDTLDMLFLGWIALAFLVIGFVNVYFKVFGFPKCLRRGTAGTPDGGGLGNTSSSGKLWNINLFNRDGESAVWINSVLSWVLQNYASRPHVVEEWMTSATSETNKYMGDIQLRFDNIVLGTTPLELTNVTTDTSSASTHKDDLKIHAKMSSRNVKLSVTVISRTATNLQSDTCDVLIVHLHAPVIIEAHFGPDSIRVQLSIQSSPDIKLVVTPSSYSTKFDKGVVQRAIEEAISKLRISVDLLGSDLSKQQNHPNLEKQSPGGTQQCNNNRRAIATVQKLMVKIIKANGLVDKDFSNCDPYARVSIDEPQQNFITSVVKNTANPFFDEHFIFDLNSNTSRLQLLIYGKRQSPPSGSTAPRTVLEDTNKEVDEFLGQAKMAIDDIRRLSKSRQIVPLSGLPKGSSSATGSLTVEFLFVNVPAETMNENATSVNSSPAVRRMEGNHLITPGGSHVTMNIDGYSQSSRENSAARELLLQPSSSTLVINTGQRPSRPTLPLLKTTQPSDDESSLAVNRPIDSKATEAKSNSLVSHIRRSFGRPKTTRARSTGPEKERTDGLLKPPDRALLDHSDGYSEDGSLRPSTRSHSLSSSFRSLFRRKKKAGEKSRDSSKSPLDVSSATLTPQSSPATKPPKGPSSTKGAGPTKGAAVPTPFISVAPENNVRYSYSSSMPPLPSPIAED